MILLLTNKDDVTCDYIIREIQKQKLDYFRLNTEDIPNIANVDFSPQDSTYILHNTIRQQEINLRNVSSIYYRRPKLSNLDYIKDITSQERRYLKNELAYSLEGIYKLLRYKFWLNNVYKIREAENKIYQLQLAQEIGLTIPETLISNNPLRVKEFYEEYDKNCILKPIKTGNMEDMESPKVIYTSKLNDDSFKNQNRIESFPMFIQRNIPKKYDLRCIVVGDNIYCAKIDSQNNSVSQIDWRKSGTPLKHKIHKLPNNIREKCIEITKTLGLNFSAIDLILDKNNNHIFLECNPNGQWAWLENRLKFPISKSIVELLDKKVMNTK